MPSTVTQKAAPDASTPVPAPRSVYALIAAVSAEVAQTGIAKDRKNVQQGYTFRSIDDVYNALAPLLAKHHLVILPRILSRDLMERTSKSGTDQFFVTVAAEFDFVSAEDGSTHTVRTYGEAQDSGDKATNKAMSAAYKYAAFQTFCIPTEGDNDADACTPEPTEPHPTRAIHAVPRIEPVKGSPQFEEWLIDLTAKADEGDPAYKNAWNAMPPDFKNWVMKHRRDARAAQLARAKAVTQAARK